MVGWGADRAGDEEEEGRKAGMVTPTREREKTAMHSLVFCNSELFPWARGGFAMKEEVTTASGRDHMFQNHGFHVQFCNLWLQLLRMMG